MKIAITSDLHLKSKSETPERYDNLSTILNILIDNQIFQLIIAGDLFDKEFNNYADFDSLCKSYSQVQFTIIPGNHDVTLEQRFFSASNLEIIKNISFKQFEDISFLFVPYISGKTMDDVLTDFFHGRSKPARFVIVGHGDYISQSIQINSYEPGIYMPLSGRVVNKIEPASVFLGHIHKPSEIGKIVYCGSPFPLDINETGKRRFVIYDTAGNNFENRLIDTDVIYFIENILILPVEDEKRFVEDKINQIIDNWQIQPNEYGKVKLRLYLRGYTRDLKETVNFVKEIFSSKGIVFYDSEPDASNLKILRENERIELLEKVKEIINIPNNFSSLEKNDIIEKAMEIIFEN
jgi:DNA repair exonuclease SbcCD nuclease subunit